MDNTKEIQKDALIDLRDQIYATRKCRINTSERYKKYNQILSGLNVWYSIWLIMVSIISFNIKDNENLKIISITTSVIVFGFSMLSLTLDCKSKYFVFRNCYIQLHLLNNKLNNIIDNNQGQNLKEEYDQISSEYNNILDSIDNHSNIDYKTFLINESWAPNSWAKNRYKDKYNIEEMKKQMKRHNRLFNIGVVILISAPIIIPIFIYLIRLWIQKL